MMIQEDIDYTEIVSYCQSRFPEEACGLVVETDDGYLFVPCENVSQQDKKEFFTISTRDYLDAAALGEVSAVVHSHTNGKAVFSDNDINSQKSSGTPWLLVGVSEDGSTPEIAWLCNKKQEYPLFGREYRWHVTDCFSFIRDYFKETYDIFIPDFYRKPKFWEDGTELYLDNLKRTDFYEVPKDTLQEGDVLLLQVGSKITSHAAVYIGNNMMAHHINGKLSEKAIYGRYYQDRTTCIVRHKDLQK